MTALASDPSGKSPPSETEIQALLASFTPWQPLDGCWLKSRLPAEPGIYRIRQQGAERLHYVGQTGSGTMVLPKRMAMLKGIYGPEMPYRDPHTVAPALWADLQRTGTDYELSVLPTPGLTTPERKGIEALIIALHRQQHGCSPRMNFGRMPSGYRMSSANNASLAQRGLRFRGGMSSAIDASHAPGLAPTGPLLGDVHGASWLGLSRSDWWPLEKAVRMAAATSGLYRIRRRSDAALSYIGEGRVRHRLLAHMTKGASSTHPQSAYFSEPESLEAAFVAADHLLPHQRLEVENDLIASHLLMLRSLPRAQFLG